MIVTHKAPYREGELRLGWASWDDGSLTERSVKYAYPDSSGKISRGAPEISLEVLLDMLKFALERGELKLGSGAGPAPLATLTRAQLVQEKRELDTALALLARFIVDFPWADFASGQERLVARQQEIAAALKTKRA